MKINPKKKIYLIFDQIYLLYFKLSKNKNRPKLIFAKSNQTDLNQESVNLYLSQKLIKILSNLILINN